MSKMRKMEKLSVKNKGYDNAYEVSPSDESRVIWGQTALDDACSTAKTVVALIFSHRKKSKEKLQKKYFNLRKLISLNRMVDGDLSYQHNDSLYRETAKLERKFPGLAEAWAQA